MESVETICNTLVRHKVLDTETVRTLHGRWREQNKERADQPAEFKKWLTKTGYVTDFQLDLLTRGFADHLFLDEYKLLDRLAKGRHAGVFQAVHGSGQKVAIKVLPPSRSKNPHVLARFLRESRLATRLDHDNIVRTFHHGKTPEGTHFIVMEYLDGDTLEEVIQRRKKLPPAEAVRLAIQMLEGLQHIDEKSMVHRDIKPANLMLVSSTSKPANGAPAPDTTLGCTLKILDIGLSRALFDEGEPDSDGKVDLTREGTLLGTMNYMAPEQARNAHAADIRADIYGVGCVLYELLCGQPPFPDKNIAVQIRRHAEETPKPLTQAVLGTPEALDRIVQKMLAKDPAMRYLTPGQALKDLRGILATLGDQQGSAAKPERPLKAFMTFLESKREPDEDAPVAATPAAAAASAPAATKVAAAVGAGTVLGPAAVATAAPKTVVAAPGPVPAATVAGPNTAAPVAVAAKPAAAKPANIPSAWSTIARRTKESSKNFVQRVLELKGRDWALLGIGALIVLLLEGLWISIRWLFS